MSISSIPHKWQYGRCLRLPSDTREFALLLSTCHIFKALLGGNEFDQLTFFFVLHYKPSIILRGIWCMNPLCCILSCDNDVMLDPNTSHQRDGWHETIYPNEWIVVVNPFGQQSQWLQNNSQWGNRLLHYSNWLWGGGIDFCVPLDFQN